MIQFFLIFTIVRNISDFLFLRAILGCWYTITFIFFISSIHKSNSIINFYPSLKVTSITLFRCIFFVLIWQSFQIPDSSYHKIRHEESTLFLNVPYFNCKNIESDYAHIKHQILFHRLLNCNRLFSTLFQCSY